MILFIFIIVRQRIILYHFRHITYLIFFFVKFKSINMFKFKHFKRRFFFPKDICKTNFNDFLFILYSAGFFFIKVNVWK